MDHEAIGKVLRQVHDLELEAEKRNDHEDVDVFWRARVALQNALMLSCERRYTENIIPGLTNF
jgi:hypothetical protein